MDAFQTLAVTNVAAINRRFDVFGWTYMVGTYTEVCTLVKGMSRLAIVSTTNHLCKVILSIYIPYSSVWELQLLHALPIQEIAYFPLPFWWGDVHMFRVTWVLFLLSTYLNLLPILPLKCLAFIYFWMPFTYSGNMPIIIYWHIHILMYIFYVYFIK